MDGEGLIQYLRMEEGMDPSELAVAAYQRYRRTGSLYDITLAVEMAHLSVRLTQEGGHDWIGSMNNLGVMLGRRYERTGVMADLEEAIDVTRHAVAATADDYPNRAGRLTNLGNKLESRYERTGVMADLEEAISVARQAVTATPDDHPDRAGCLNNLGTKLESRWQRTGVMADLEEAISVARQAVDATPEDPPDRAACSNNLGNKLNRRYERTGAMADLEEAIGVARLAVTATPHDHPDRAGCLNNLGTKLESRYERTGVMADLEEAIIVARQAVTATPHDHPDRVVYSNNVGTKLERRYERTGAMADLEEAIGVARQAVDATPDDHPDSAVWLNNLGNKLESRHERTGTMEDLEEAISIAGQAVTATPHDHPGRVAYLNNLGTKLGRRYERTGAMADLEEAIGVARQAVTATPENHPDRAGSLNNLGNKLESRYERTGVMANLEEATSCFRQTWDLKAAIPFHRIRAVVRCLTSLAFQERLDEAVQLGKDAIHLLPTINTKLLSRDDQQHVVSTFAGLAANLCSCLLALNQSENALRYLEEGRAVIIGDLLDNRSNASSVAKNYPDLAHQFEDLRGAVNVPLCERQSGPEREQHIAQHRQAMLDLEACIRQIRTKPGLERFLLGLTTTEMRQCAAEGSVIVVNIGTFRSDAIIITSTDIRTSQLTKLSPSEAEKWLSKDWGGRKAERAAKNREYLAYLAWLWKSCVEEVLDEVRILQGSSEAALVRVWWIGSGLASSMPFHAAGIHHRGSTETALHRAISSYTPSIKALAHARKRAEFSRKTSGSLLLATMPTTPAQEGDRALPSLPGAEREKDVLLEVTEGHIQAEYLEGPSVDDVLEALPRCSIAHFACHGSSDHVDPSMSGLILQRRRDIVGGAAGREGASDTAFVQDRLSVSRISELSLRRARLAYLSACSTAQNKAEFLSDEVIHAVSGFQVAGFPHVVGCLWPSNDRTCMEVASGFYSRLLGQESPWRDDRVARAMRDAVMEVMENGEMEAPLNWALYVHYGP